MTTTRSNFPSREDLERTIREACADALNRQAYVMQRHQRDVMPTSGTPSIPYTPPRRDYGTLVRSVRVLKTATVDSLRSRSGSMLDHGYWMEHGVKSKGKKLTVPLHRAASNLRAQVSDLRMAGNKMRLQVGKRFMLLGIDRGRGKSRTFEAWFALKDEILPRPWNRWANELGTLDAQAQGRRRFKNSLNRRLSVLKAATENA